MTVAGKLLLGCNHTELGEVATEALPPNTAIGISRGRFPKGYTHVDPNEDAVFAATDGTTTILVVADGHRGFDAAHEAVLAIADIAAATITRDLESIVRDLAVASIAAVAKRIPALEPPRDASRTALTICTIRDRDLATTTLGDTGCFISSKRRTTRVGITTPFLAPHTDPDTLEIETTEIPVRSIVVATSDGFIDFAPSIDRSLRAAAKLRPGPAVESLITAAFSGGAGDNIAFAVYRPPA